MIVVFLDRDGVINKNRDDYVKTVEEFVVLPGALEGLAKLREAGITTVVVSNQAGIGRGLIDPSELERINQTMRRAAAEGGGEISAVYFCPHNRDAGCDCRKPEIGLFVRASRDMGFALTDSYFVGDAKSDIEAGRRAGCTTVLVLTGKSTAADVAEWDHKPEHIADDLPSAVDWILNRQAADSAHTRG